MEKSGIITEFHPIVKIKGQMCTILGVRDIETAEKLCKTWNKYNFNQKQILKVHLHPSSNLIKDENTSSNKPENKI